MKVFIVGTGNVAYTLGRSFAAAGHTITGVFGRTEENVLALSRKLKCRGFTDPASIPLHADIYLVAVSDDAVEKVAGIIPNVKGVVAHTAGAVAMNLLRKFRNHGVFYPVETITRTHPRNFKKVPVIIEASGEFSLKKLMQLAHSVSDEIFSLDSGQRAILHVAAVFTNNFTNALLGIATGLLGKEQIPQDLLRPLALSTVNNAFTYGSIESQTGPAKRNDHKTIQKHLELLKAHPEYHRIYEVMTRHIRHVHKKK